VYGLPLYVPAPDSFLSGAPRTGQVAFLNILTLDTLKSGGKAGIARALTVIEEQAGSPETAALLDVAWRAPMAHVIGLTGPPGVGKSTLIDALIRCYREAGQSVAIIAVDPSSRKTGGALLGDRTRFRNNPDDNGVFVRSLAARGQLGGLAALAFPSVALLAALYDRVLVETVGVGQSEADVSGVAETVVLCVQPGSGDALQFMKAGIMEIPDIAVVTRADVGLAARQALSDLKGALSLSPGDGREMPQFTVSSRTGEGIDELVSACDAHRAWLESHDRPGQRNVQARAWLAGTVASRFGSDGVKALDGVDLETGLSGPFGRARELISGLEVVRKT